MHGSQVHHCPSLFWNGRVVVDLYEDPVPPLETQLSRGRCGDMIRLREAATHPRLPGSDYMPWHPLASRALLFIPGPWTAHITSQGQLHDLPLFHVLSQDLARNAGSGESRARRSCYVDEMASVATTLPIGPRIMLWKSRPVGPSRNGAKVYTWGPQG